MKTKKPPKKFKILGCHNCGRKPQCWIHDDAHRIRCGRCPDAGAFGFTPSDVVRTWNRRTKATYVISEEDFK